MKGGWGLLGSGRPAGSGAHANKALTVICAMVGMYDVVSSYSAGQVDDTLAPAGRIVRRDFDDEAGGARVGVHSKLLFICVACAFALAP